MTEPKVSPESLTLRAPPRPVTRLNRRTLAVVIGVLAAAVLGATIWSLQSQRKTSRDAPVELHNTERIAHADGLEQLPPDYSKLAAATSAAATSSPPVLGSPLPGDLGGALLRADQQAAISSATSNAPIALRADPAADAARVERINRQREAEEAAKAPIFFRGSTRKEATPTTAATPQASAATATNGEAQPTSPSQPSTTNPAAAQNMQDQKKSFLDRTSDTAVLSTHALQTAVSPYQVMAGSVIPAALITGINSDLPGQVLATVTEPVYDTATGRHLLIPQGSRLLGQYDSQVAFGQRRVLLVWNRLMFPDASSIVLDRLQGTDPAGNAGLSDDVDWHWQQLLAGAALSTLIGVAAELATPQFSTGQGQVIVATRQSIGDTVNQVGQELTRRNLNVQPTLTIRPGFPVRVIVNKDLVLRPYQPLFFERSAR
jgi:type IV secretory pathway VirB10-like protein